MSATLAASVHEIDVAPDIEALFRAHYGRLVRALALVAGSTEAASDAVQEAFVKAHLHWRKIQHYDDPVAWIRRVAINKLRDEHRRHQRRQRLAERIGPDVPATVAEPELQELGALLNGLPRQQRLAVALYYVDQLSVAEIAEALGISAGAVKFHLHQGRNRLRNIVTDEGISDE